MQNHRTKPEIPATKVPSSPGSEKSAVYRRLRVRIPDPLATLVEEVVTSPRDPRWEP
jgi:hypothetical protein